ncbi:hypothetical protein [Sporomusa termitida]|uniref:hypothetical protein n=1 Tax=Sporomusa termitida TaxID=2377 RepID=UPI001185F707|nr:hypothetical protein [Sporomusa termitida]
MPPDDFQQFTVWLKHVLKPGIEHKCGLLELYQAGELARETGIGEANLHQWRKKARSKGYAAPADGQTSECWCTQNREA